MSRASARRGLAPRAFRCALGEWEATIARFAERLAHGDPDLADDLAQVGRIALWRRPPSSDAARTRTILYRRMLDHRRASATRRLTTGSLLPYRPLTAPSGTAASPPAPRHPRTAA